MHIAEERALESEMSPNAILYVVRLLKNCYEYSRRKQILYDFNLFRDMEQFGVPDEYQVKLVLLWLKKKGIVRYRDYSDPNDNPWIKLEFDRDKPSTSTFIIEIVDLKSLVEIFRKILGSQVDEAIEQVVCTFDVKTGIGYLNGKRFSLSGKPSMVFNEFYQNSGNWCERNRILNLIDKTINTKSSSSTIQLNTFITNLRKATGLNKNQLELVKGNVKLNIKRQVVY